MLVLVINMKLENITDKHGVKYLVVMTTRALKIESGFGKLTQEGTARKVRRQAKRAGISDVNTGQRIHYAEHFLKNPIKTLMGRPEMKTMLVSNFRYSADPTLGGIKSRARMTEAVAVKGKNLTDDKVVASACIDPSGHFANGQINSTGIGNMDYIGHNAPSMQQDYSSAAANSNQPAAPTPAPSQHTHDAPAFEMAA